MISRFRCKSQFLNQGAAHNPPLCKPALTVVFHVSLVAKVLHATRYETGSALSSLPAVAPQPSNVTWRVSISHAEPLRKNLITSLFVVCGCRRSPMSAAALTCSPRATITFYWGCGRRVGAAYRVDRTEQVPIKTKTVRGCIAAAHHV